MIFSKFTVAVATKIIGEIVTGLAILAIVFSFVWPFQIGLGNVCNSPVMASFFVRNGIVEVHWGWFRPQAGFAAFSGYDFPEGTFRLFNFGRPPILWNGPNFGETTFGFGVGQLPVINGAPKGARYIACPGIVLLLPLLALLLIPAFKKRLTKQGSGFEVLRPSR